MIESASTPVYEGRDLEAMASAPNYHRWVFEEFSPFIGSSIAEVGAGAGHFSEFLLSANPESLVLVEPSMNLYRHTSARFAGVAHVKVVRGYFPKMAHCVSDRLETAVYVNVLEHVKDDRAELEAVYKALKPGGYVCIYVPALTWLYSDFDAEVGHYRRYMRDDLGALLRTTGFDVIRLKYMDLLGVFPWFIAFRQLGRRLTGRQAGLYDRFVVPWLSRTERYLTVPLGKNLLAVGRKPLA